MNAYQFNASHYFDEVLTVGDSHVCSSPVSCRMPVRISAYRDPAIACDTGQKLQNLTTAEFYKSGFFKIFHRNQGRLPPRENR